jgi:hypothetical protein
MLARMRMVLSASFAFNVADAMPERAKNNEKSQMATRKGQVSGEHRNGGGRRELSDGIYDNQEVFVAEWNGTAQGGGCAACALIRNAQT